MKIIGLTGGIGAGKSTVSDYLRHKGFTIIDADRIARDIVEPGSQTLVELTKLFGKDILLEDSSLDRKKLGSIVFSNTEKKLMLDKLMHEKVIEIIEKKINKMKDLNESVIFIDAPLLFESGLNKYANETWVVDLEDETRINRIMERDDLSRDEILNRIANQMSRQKKNRLADKIINNTGNKKELYIQIENLLEKIYN
ncbi:dephospho-CoA kinase [Anaerovorax odorimutans]|uniref:dephospho-CoA kinase n=1 Tax=Anaerovorax odorimutans TaxID=109327 RepID=UPI000420B199|nr:dephospho-CoA kinase [Anaerovorax odorimutans]